MAAVAGRVGPAHSVSVRKVWSARGFAIVGLAVLLYAGCGSGARGHQAAVAVVAARSSSTGIEVSLVLNGNRYPADGAAIVGYLDIVNRTGKPIALDDACNGWVNVGLTNADVAFRPLTGAVGCARPKLLSPGTSRTRIQILTTLTSCSGDPSNHSGLPNCVGRTHEQLPPLAAGHYRTQVIFGRSRPGLPVPAPVNITLTKP